MSREVSTTAEYTVADQQRMQRARRYFAWQARMATQQIGRRVIEIGCGLGNFTEYLLDREQVVALDVVDDCLEHLRRRFPDRANLETRRLDVQDREFLELRRCRPDTVVCLNVLEHVREDRRALEHMHQVLQPGGRAIFILPAFESLYGPIDRNLGHFRRYSKGPWRELAQAAGFRVTQARYLNSVGFIAWWLNAKVLKKTEQSEAQIAMFDSVIVPPLSRLERALEPPFGQSIFTVLEKIFAMKISILIPVYNEALTLPLVVERVLAAPLPEGCEKEVVIIDDGSTDGTTELLARYRDTPLVAVHHSVVNFGKGAALRIGIAKSTGDVILVQDGDLEYDPNDYPRVLEPIVSGRAKVVYGSRFLKLDQPRIGGTREMKFANWIANKVLTLTANLLYGARLTDEATAYKAFAREVLDAVQLRCVRFEFCPEVTAKVRRLGYEIAEVGISYNPRGILEGKKIRWQDGVEALWTLLKYRAAPAVSFDRRLATPRARTSGAGA